MSRRTIGRTSKEEPIKQLFYAVAAHLAIMLQSLMVYSNGQHEIT